MRRPARWLPALFVLSWPISAPGLPGLHRRTPRSRSRSPRSACSCWSAGPGSSRWPPPALFASAIYFSTAYLNRPNSAGPGWPWVLAALVVILGAGRVMALLAMSSARLPGIYLLVLTLGLQVVIERTVFTYGHFSGGLGGGDEDGDIVVNRRPQSSIWTSATAEFTRGSDRTHVGDGLLLLLPVLAGARPGRSSCGCGARPMGLGSCSSAPTGRPPPRSGSTRCASGSTPSRLRSARGHRRHPACWLLVNPPVVRQLPLPVLAGAARDPGPGRAWTRSRSSLVVARRLPAGAGACWSRCGSRRSSSPASA